MPTCAMLVLVSSDSRRGETKMPHRCNRVAAGRRTQLRALRLLSSCRLINASLPAPAWHSCTRVPSSSSSRRSASSFPQSLSLSPSPPSLVLVFMPCRDCGVHIVALGILSCLTVFVIPRASPYSICICMPSASACLAQHSLCQVLRPCIPHVPSRVCHAPSCS